MLKTTVLCFLLAALLPAQDSDGKLHVIAFGAHPDDCDIRAAGTAVKFAALGHHVKFVSVTNGDAGHQSQGGGMLAKRRRAEAIESARRLGITYEVLDNHDGELLPTLKVREQIIRQIRQWKADIVLAPRPNDYHPDHRAVGQLVQDASYMVTVPFFCPDTPHLERNPVFLSFNDGFTRPNPLRADIVVAIDDVVEKKLAAVEALLEAKGLTWADFAFVGDDLADLPILKRAGLAITVANGCPETKALCAWVTRAQGGHGAVREVVEELLRARGEWDEAVATYLRERGETAP